MSFAADVTVMLADFGVTVTDGTSTAKGLLDFDQHLVENAFGERADFVEAVLLKTGAIAAMALGLALTVDGTGYTVRDFRKLDDGEVTLVLLASA